jgi:uncharacterized repeat protein (TIGR04076 family)
MNSLQEAASMARDSVVGYKITATVISVKGNCGGGHQVGECFPISCHDSGGLCGFFYHNLFPELQTFQFGGKMPWWEQAGNVMVAQCPDPGNTVTLRLERTPRG